jgi:enoyl-CoA hydratase/carnithine racemase
LIGSDRSIYFNTETIMATFENAYANAKMTRSADGILEVTFHTNGGKLVFNGHTHEQFTDMFHEIGEDYDNRVVILTEAATLSWMRSMRKASISSRLAATTRSSAKAERSS